MAVHNILIFFFLFFFKGLHKISCLQSKQMHIDMWLKIQLMDHSQNIHIIQYFIIQDVMELKSSG